MKIYDWDSIKKKRLIKRIMETSVGFQHPFLEEKTIEELGKIQKETLIEFLIRWKFKNRNSFIK